jgi:hypothetical protein
MHQIESTASETRHPGAVDPVGESRNEIPSFGDRSLVARVMEASERLARAERRVVRMRMSLRGLDRTGPEFPELLSCLQALERCRYNRQLELDTLRRELARSPRGARQPGSGK